MIRKLSRYILRISGWKIAGELPRQKKYVVVVAPHTSNWDFVWGQLYYLAAGIRAKIMIKKELFYFPLGNLLKLLGGIPVDRHGNSDIVEQMINEFKMRDSFILVLTPEGTRSRVDEWKTGFHRIASGANVPVVPGFIDYKNKIIGTGDFFHPGSDVDKDMLKIKRFYRNVTPKFPENFSLGNIDQG